MKEKWLLLTNGRACPCLECQVISAAFRVKVIKTCFGEFAPPLPESSQVPSVLFEMTLKRFYRLLVAKSISYQYKLNYNISKKSGNILNIRIISVSSICRDHLIDCNLVPVHLQYLMFSAMIHYLTIFSSSLNPISQAKVDDYSNIYRKLAFCFK